MRGALLLLPLLAACGSGGGDTVAALGCSGELRLRNQGPVMVEQAFVSARGPGDWGPDLLAPGTLPPGAEQVVRGTPGRNAVRIVFANGRAAEIPSLDVCATPSLGIQPTGLLASR
jgi:hypothetical protein